MISRARIAWAGLQPTKAPVVLFQTASRLAPCPCAGLGHDTDPVLALDVTMHLLATLPIPRCIGEGVSAADEKSEGSRDLQVGLECQNRTVLVGNGADCPRVDTLEEGELSRPALLQPGSQSVKVGASQGKVSPVVGNPKKAPPPTKAQLAFDPSKALAGISLAGTECEVGDPKFRGKVKANPDWSEFEDWEQEGGFRGGDLMEQIPKAGRTGYSTRSSGKRKGKVKIGQYWVGD